MADQLTTRSPRGLANLWRRDPFTTLRDEMNALRAQMWGDGDEGFFSGGLATNVDLSETDNSVEVRMDIPGVKAKDIDIQVNGQLLTVSAQREEEREEKGRTFHRIERQSGRYSRSLTLPCHVNESEVAAEYHDGVLSITLPKSEESKAHKIKVKG
jgi:HSP20 family protein